MDCVLSGAVKCVIRSLYGHDFHIGVDSDVVCSTTIGNCKSLRKWNGQQDDSTLFFCRNLTDFCLEKSLQGELIDDFLISSFDRLLYDTDEIRYTTAKNYNDEGNLTGETAEAEPTPYQKTANCKKNMKQNLVGMG